MKKITAETFDILGLFTFSFLILISSWTLLTNNPFPKWAVILLLIGGIVGLIIDGTIVYRTFIKKTKF